jgi:porin
MKSKTKNKIFALLLASLSCPPHPLKADDSDMIASLSIDEVDRFDRTPKTPTPLPQVPTTATSQNTDAGKSFLDWSSATDDWGGLRPKLDDRGLTFQANITYDGTAVTQGGVRRDIFASRMLLNFNLTVDTARLMNLPGGTFFTNFQYQCGRNGSADAGAFQSPSNIDSHSLAQLSELWYEQKVLDDKLRIKAGKLDLSTEFATNTAGGEFLNASMGFSPTIVDFPTYPDPATGLMLSVEPDPHVYLRGGVYDGALQRGIHTGARGPATLFGPPADLFLITEAGVLWSEDDKLPVGHFAAGAWRQTGSFTRFDGHGFEAGTNGLYFVLNQNIWQPSDADKNDARGVAGFLQYGYADGAVSAVSQHIGLGAAWTGPVHGRDSDVLGLGTTWVKFASASGAGFDQPDELTTELFYKVQITPFFVIKPDLQYIHHPGASSASNDAVVLGVRSVIQF